MRRGGPALKTRAAILLEMGRPRPYAESRPVVVDEVELEEPGYGEVLVELKAAGICHSDLSVVDGSRPRPTPMVLGHEAAGIVRATGPGVTAVQAGDHVVFTFVPMCGRCTYCTSGRPALCELGNAANARGELLRGGRRFHRHGQPVHHHLGVSAFAQFTVAAEESLIKIDPDIPFDVAAVFGCAVMTGVGAVVNTARVEPGSSVAVFGLGGVGLAAVMGAVGWENWLAPEKNASAAGTGLAASELVSVIPKMKSFQIAKNVRIAAVNTPGAASGTITLRNACNGVAPSTCAACSISHGISRKNALSTYTDSGSEKDRSSMRIRSP